MVKYRITMNEDEIKDKINNLDKMANSYLLRIIDLHMEDLYLMSLIDKSIKLIDTFLFALEKRNITVMAVLTRVQMDCLMRAFATTLVADSGQFCKAVLVDKESVNRLVDKTGYKLTDKNICEKLEVYLGLPIYDLYKKVSGFIHFSADSFSNIAKAKNENGIDMFISRNNRSEDEKVYERLALELANQFYYFGSVLIEDVFLSWLRQKGE